MRRILRVIYLIPVALVLLIGAGFAFYYLLLKPQIEAVQKDQASWASAKDEVKKMEATYVSSLADEGTSAKKFYEDNYCFHAIQSKMPGIYDVKDAPLDELLQHAPAFQFDPKWTPDRKKLYYWYYTMATGQLIRELNGWAKGFHLASNSTFPFNEKGFSGTLGYESTLPSVKVVHADFGTQTIKALGIAQLLHQLQGQTGYDYFPLIISVSSPITLTVDTTNPKYGPNTPPLSLDFNAEGYFITRGWDPAGEDKDVQSTVEDAKKLILNPKKEQMPRDEKTAEAQCPPVLGYYFPAGMEK